MVNPEIPPLAIAHVQGDRLASGTEGLTGTTTPHAGPFAPTKTTTRFGSDAAELDGVRRAMDQVTAWDEAGLIPHTMESRPPSAAVRYRLTRMAVVVTGFPGGYGSGLTRSGRGTEPMITPTANLMNTLVLCERDPADGAWFPVTHYPTDKPVTCLPWPEPEPDRPHFPLRPQLDNAFTCWFNADDIDFRNMDDVLSRADTVAMMLLDSGLPQAEILAPLQAALRRWGPFVIAAFCDTGYIAWDAEVAHEDMLRSIVQRIVAVVEEGGTRLHRLEVEEYLYLTGQDEP